MILVSIVVVAILGVAASYQPLITCSVLALLALAFVAVTGANIVRHRQAAFPEALEMVKARNVVRTSTHDLYMPPAPEHRPRSSSSSNDKALLFLPGALVEPAAYASIALRLANEHGILVAVVNTEPLRLPQPLPLGMGINASTLIQIAHQVEQIVGKEYQWNLGGHSLGASTAVAQFPLIQKEQNNRWKKVVCLAAGIRPSSSGTLNRRTLLLVQASNDGFIQFYRDQEPSWFSMATIPGGNHAGFGHYGPQVHPVTDGPRTIPLEEQHSLTAKIVADFLLD